VLALQHTYLFIFGVRKMQDKTTHQVLVEDDDNFGTDQAPGHGSADHVDNSPSDPVEEQSTPEFSTHENYAKANSVRDQVLHLSRSDGGASNTMLEDWTPTFQELCELLQRPPDVCDKDGSYFVRGPCLEGQSTRADANIKRASAIVVDADSTLDPETGEITEGAPPPDSLHKALVELDIPHLIYTTHSHGQPGKGYRFRVLIPADAQDAGELKGYLRWIFHLLNEKGCWLVDVRENHVWSQPWFFPRLASEDSEYLFFIYDTGTAFDTRAALEWHEAESAVVADITDKVKTNSVPRDTGSIFAQFNAEYGNPKWMLDLLDGEGYSLVSTSQVNDEMSYRLLSPTSSNGNAGVILFLAENGVWRVYSHHSRHDPLSKDGEEVTTSDAWDLYRIFEHNDDEHQAISVWEEANDARPIIKIRPGEVGSSLTAAVKALAQMDPPTVYQRAQALCRIAHLQETSDTQGCSIPKGTAHIVTLHRSGLTVEASESAVWKKRQKNGEWKKIDPCPKVVGALLEAVGKWPGIPFLLGISEAPILRQAGSLLAEPGYDVSTRLYVEGSFPEFELPDEVSLEQAKEAAETLLAPFREFPFVDKAVDESVLLAYMLTLALRPQLTTAPLFCISATTPGSGKGLVIEVANQIVRGRDAATMPPVQGSAGEDETRKRITALLIQGVSSVNLDNWSKPIGGEAMNALLTASEWTDRVLGVSTTVSLPNRITLAATGNNLSVRGDMTRRALLIQLDPAVERPELRVFEERDLLGHIAEDRAALLTALFTILKGYQQAGYPDAHANPLGRFEQWCTAVCGPIRWMGYTDPLESQERLRAQDPEAEKLELLLSAWYDLAGNDWKTAAGIIEATEEGFNAQPTAIQRSMLRDGLVEAAPDGRGNIARLKLGWFLRHFTGRIAGGYRLEKKSKGGSKSKKPQQYRVVELAAPGGDE